MTTNPRYCSTMTNGTRILLTAIVAGSTGLVAGAFVAADEPVDVIAVDEPSTTTTLYELPYAPIADTLPDQEWTGVEGGVLVDEGYGYRIYDAPLPDPSYDECWSDDGSTTLASGDFVIFDVETDGRRWGTHSIGAMPCGPADTPFPTTTTTTSAAVEPVVAAVEPDACP